MTSPKNRSTSIRKVKRRSPSGDSREYYIRRKTVGKGSCAVCKAKLLGISSVGAKSSRRPERKFGGVLCPNCQKKVVVEATRVKDKFKSIEDVALMYRKYVEGILK